MCLADARMFLPGLNLTLHGPGQHGRVDGGPGAVRRSPGVRGGVLPARETTRSSDGTRRPPSRRRPLAWLPREIVHRPKAPFPPRCGPGSRHDLRGAGRRGRATASWSVGFLRRTLWRGWSPTTAAGREDRSKQIWQLLTLEYWYRRCNAAGVAVSRNGLGSREQVKQVAQNY